MPCNHLILCHPLFSSLQSFPASGSFPKSWLFASGGQSIRASASVLPKNTQGQILHYTAKCQSSLLHLTKMIYMLVSPIRLLDQERKYLLIILCPCQLVKRGMAHPRCFDCLMNELVSSYINQLTNIQIIFKFTKHHLSIMFFILQGLYSHLHVISV